MSRPTTAGATPGTVLDGALRPVGAGFVLLYTLALASTSLMFVAPLLVSLALKVEDLVGSRSAPGALSLVVGAGAFVSLVANPAFGRLSDRTRSRHGMRRPWMVVGLLGGTVGVLIVAAAPSLPVALIGWCVAQAMFNALLAAMVAVLADRVPEHQRGWVAGFLGVCVPVGAVAATFLVQAVEDRGLFAVFLVPCLVGGVFVLSFVAVLEDRRLERPVERRASRVRDVLGTFYVAPQRCPDFAWAFGSRFLFVLAYAFLITYQPFYLVEHLGRDQDEVADFIFHGTLASSSMVVVASVVAGRLSDRWQRRRAFVCAAALVYAVALWTVAAAGSVTVFLVGMAIAGIGFGMYVAVDLALVTEVLPDRADVAKDLGVFNIAGALPFSVGPALAPALLAWGGGSYPALYAVAGVSALASAGLILRVRTVR